MGLTLKKRKAGILLPVSSLPSAYGIGDFGAGAYDFINFLADSGQSIWQILPIGPTGLHNSPYQCLSAFAGNPSFVDLNALVMDDLLSIEDISGDWTKDEKRADYDLQVEKKIPLLIKASENFDEKDPDYLKFVNENKDWLMDYAMFASLRRLLDAENLDAWEDRLRNPSEDIFKEIRESFASQIKHRMIIQYFFFSQWKELKTYANSRGISIIGDIPLYVSEDSSDFWINRELFDVDSDGRTCTTAGVPPDEFSADGQIWNNPVYAWKTKKPELLSWWKRRIAQAAELYDGVRIDHFRGLSEYFSIPIIEGKADVECGEFLPGPGRELIDMIKSNFPDFMIIAEDLGKIFQETRELLAYSEYPGMKVLQFAFAGGSGNEYLPHNHIRNSVVYTGTHDNNTISGWVKGLDSRDLTFTKEYLGVKSSLYLPDAMIKAALSSIADTAIIPLQDWLGLGERARFNTPSTVDGSNWRWRVSKDALTPVLSEYIFYCTKELFDR